MKTRNKILVDRLVALPLSWSLNLAARALGRLLRRDHSATPSNVRTIVIAKYLGMGSILQASPLIRSVRAEFPNARLIFLTGKGCRRMVERIEGIDTIITVDDGSLFRAATSTLSALGKLVGARVDLFFDLEVYSAYASVMALLSLARNRIGFYRESAQHKRGNYTHLMYFNTRNPIRHIYLQLGRMVGCEPVEADRLGPIRVDQADRVEVAAALGDGLKPGGYFVVNPNASDLLVERRWPREKFATLIARLVEAHGLPVVLIGSPAERPYVTELAAQIEGAEGKVLNLAGGLSLGGLFALLEGARCVVTNDTGPMHMAWALRAPTVGLFGPVDPAHYGWNAPDVRIVHKPVYCSPCVHEVDEPPCHGDNVCMKRITIDEVLEGVQSVLSAPADSTPRPTRTPSFFGDPGEGPLGQIVRGRYERWTRTAVPQQPPSTSTSTPVPVPVLAPIEANPEEPSETTRSSRATT